MIDLRPDHLEIVRDLLRQHVPGCEVRAFGSRFKWTAKQASDLDLAVVGTKRLPTKKIMRLKEAFEESILPMRVDVLDWHAITPEFQRVIDAGFEVIQEGGEVSPLASASLPSAAGSSATPLFDRDWSSTTIGAVIANGKGEIKTGPFGTKLKASEYTETGVPVISVGEVGFGRFTLRGETPKVDESVTSRMPEYVLHTGDIVFGRKGSVERSSIVRTEQDGWFLGSDGIRLRLPSTVDALFIAYQFQTEVHKNWMIQHAAGSTMPSLNQGTIERIPVVIPPLHIQKTISHILGRLDDRIELCRRTNETLESTARALFKDWFIDFGPVRAKLEGRESYLPKDVLDIFPARLIESERGEIPEGWSYGSILSIARLLSGGTPKTSEATFWDGNIKWASAKDISQCGETFLLETERKITTLGLEKSSTKLIPAFSTVIVARGATTGRLTMFGEEMAMNQTCYGLHSKFNAPFALYCHTRDFIDSMVSAAHGSVFDTITTQTFEATPVLLPSEKTLKAFDKQTSEIFSQILANLTRIRSLVETRDFLLPRLLSGKLSTDKIQGLVCD